MRATVIGLALAAAVLSPRSAYAWGDEGHEITALIAWKHLDPGVKATVKQMLAADPGDLTAPEIASAATWADKHRDSDRNTTKVRYNLTREWHFVDLEIDHPDMAAACFDHPAPEVPASKGPAKACVIDRIAAFRKELQSLPAGVSERVIALKFMLHFVGDLHQPLHAADHEDRGGNTVMVLFANRTVGTALHGFWDTEVVKRLAHDPNVVANTLDQKFAGQCSGWMAGSPPDWAQESFGLARDKVYNFG
jgi:nuclease S1